ncbi:Uncharacterised protein [uncultured archaeon]|nr:Uncharacterised protein [uncultured archaeon]
MEKGIALTEQTKKSFTITKKIAKHGSQAVIVIPRILEQHLKPGTIVELGINIISISEDKEIKFDGEKNNGK